MLILCVSGMTEECTRHYELGLLGSLVLFANMTPAGSTTDTSEVKQIFEVNLGVQSRYNILMFYGNKTKSYNI